MSNNGKTPGNHIVEKAKPAPVQSISDSGKKKSIDDRSVEIPEEESSFTVIPGSVNAQNSRIYFYYDPGMSGDEVEKSLVETVLNAMSNNPFNAVMLGLAYGKAVMASAEEKQVHRDGAKFMNDKNHEILEKRLNNKNQIKELRDETKRFDREVENRIGLYSDLAGKAGISESFEDIEKAINVNPEIIAAREGLVLLPEKRTGWFGWLGRFSGIFLGTSLGLVGGILVLGDIKNFELNPLILLFGIFGVIVLEGQGLAITKVAETVFSFLLEVQSGKENHPHNIGARNIIIIAILILGLACISTFTLAEVFTEGQAIREISIQSVIKAQKLKGELTTVSAEPVSHFIAFIIGALINLGYLTYKGFSAILGMKRRTNLHWILYKAESERRDMLQDSNLTGLIKVAQEMRYYKTESIIRQEKLKEIEDKDFPYITELPEPYKTRLALARLASSGVRYRFEKMLLKLSSLKSRILEDDSSRSGDSAWERKSWWSKLMSLFS